MQKQQPQFKSKKVTRPNSVQVSFNPATDEVVVPARRGRIKRQLNYLPIMMRYYLLYAMSHREPEELRKEIKCEKCGSYEGLELHHRKYYPDEEVTIDDIHLLCNKCHRNDDNPKSLIKTVFENGSRFCVGSWFKFEYIILIFSLLFALPTYAKEYTDEQIVNAIYKAEGADKATYPYGIRSISCEGLTECRQVCLNTVKNNRKRYADYGHKQYDTYLEFLASRYAPVNAENDPKRLNQNWLKNVIYFLEKEAK